MKKAFVSFMILLSLFFLVSCSTNSLQENGSDAENPDRADLSGMDFSFSDRDLDYDLHSPSPEEGSHDGTVLTITASGTYEVAGENLSKIVVAAADDDKIQILFSGARIESTSGPAIEIQSADKVFLTFLEGTETVISDRADGYSEYEQTGFDAAVFSKADLTLNGLGTVKIEGNYKHGVASKDDLVVTGLVLSVSAKKVGLNGKDCVKISDADISVRAGSDAIRSDNTEDADRGYIYVQGASLGLTADNDGIQAQTVLKLEECDVKIKSGKGSETLLSDSSDSFKGLKAQSDIIVESGTFEIDSRDDSIHSNHTVSILGGALKLRSGDDGIHADTDLSISGGNIEILKSYEALEATKIMISGGSLNLNARDDGLNAAGGNDQSAFGGRPGMGNFASASGKIVISGGYTVVNANGDGIDANGSISISGGVTLISGSTNGGNGALDYDTEASVSGGVLIALGATGMAQGFSKAENQGAILVGFSTQKAECSIALLDEKDAVLVSFTPEKEYQCAVITCPQIAQAKCYRVVCGGTVLNADSAGFAENSSVSGGSELCKIEMTSLLYQSISQGGMQGGGPGGMRPNDGGQGPGFGGGKQERPNFRFS